jgi:hypothetical protein
MIKGNISIPDVQPREWRARKGKRKQPPLPIRIVVPTIAPKQARFCAWAKALAPKE